MQIDGRIWNDFGHIVCYWLQIDCVMCAVWSLSSSRGFLYSVSVCLCVCVYVCMCVWCLCVCVYVTIACVCVCIVYCILHVYTLYVCVHCMCVYCGCVSTCNCIQDYIIYCNLYILCNSMLYCTATYDQLSLKITKVVNEIIKAKVKIHSYSNKNFLFASLLTDFILPWRNASQP